MKKIFILLAIVFIVANTQTQAQKVINKITKSKVLVIGTSAEQFPFTFKDSDGKLNGIDIKIANALAKEMGVTAKFEVMSFDKLIPALQEGKIDIILSGMSISTKRNMKVAFPEVYYKTGKSLLTFNKKISKGNISDINKETITIAVTDKSTSAKYVKAKYPKAKITLVKNLEEAEKLLLTKKVDGIMADYETIEMIAFKIADKSLYYQNISKSTEKEFLSPAISASDHLFINLVSNFIKRINAYDEDSAIESLWIEFLN